MVRPGLLSSELIHSPQYLELRGTPLAIATLHKKNSS
jgi:hypothetical protein